MQSLPYALYRSLVTLIVPEAHARAWGIDAVYAAMDMTNRAYRSEIDMHALPSLFPLALTAVLRDFDECAELFLFNLIPIGAAGWQPDYPVFPAVSGGAAL